MTVGGDYIPTGEINESEQPNYPVVFGISLTPLVQGILIAALGLAGAGWLLVNVVQPTWQRNQELRQDIRTKEQQLADQGEVQRQIDEARQQLQEAKQLQADVLKLFASEESLDTLLLDVNERVQAANARIADPERRAKLSKFDLEAPPPPLPDGRPGDVITDGSFGSAVNDRLRRRVYNVEMEGSFAQIQSIIRNIERLQPLLVVQNFKQELVEPPPLVLSQQGRPVATAASEPRLRASFQLVALMPAPPPPAPAPAPEGEQGTQEGTGEATGQSQ
ncbi:MAG TPA: pilus assembly protein PilO [Synechococcales cyanobacterium M55_K2018_004]|nr:pilus assembly protein PilO [Synechococcales cyanobacterium M55_K2018_004]